MIKRGHNKNLIFGGGLKENPDAIKLFMLDLVSAAQNTHKNSTLICIMPSTVLYTCLLLFIFDTFFEVENMMQ